MAKKNKKPNMGLLVTKYACFSILLLIGIGLMIFGMNKLFGAGLERDKALIECEDKDYSSYVKTVTNTTPGNEKINEQVRTLEDAMNRASEANDVTAFGQLYEMYQEALSLQAQTSTTNTSSDYSAVEEAKQRCRDLADKQMNTDKDLGQICISASVTLILMAISLTIMFVIIDRKKYC